MTLELEILKTAFGGDGIASYNGKVCFVEGALPGERVEAEVLQDKKNFLKARVVKILKASPRRIESACQYYSHCGGCQYHHVSYEEELHLKQEQARETLDRIGVAAALQPIRHAPKEQGYRNSLTLHAIGDVKKPRSLGFIGRDNISRIPVRECLIADERFAPIFSAKHTLPKGAEDISFKLDEKGRLFSDKDEAFMRIHLAGVSLCAHTKGFFQANLPVTELLVAGVRSWVERASPEVFVDLYAGVGTFGILCAQNTRAIVAVEESRFNLQALRMNREEKGLSQMEIVEGRVEKTLDSWFGRIAKKTVVLMDPPRQGLERNVAERLAACDAEALIYVSCDLMTLVRDIQLILGGSYFTVSEIVPYDMFPRTKHIEIAALLVRK